MDTFLEDPIASPDIVQELLDVNSQQYQSADFHIIGDTRMAGYTRNRQTDIQRCLPRSTLPARANQPS